MSIEADPNDVRPHLPEGFEPTGFGVDQAATLNLISFRCDGAIVDNRTVIAPLGFAITTAFVSVNQTLGEGAELHRYLFEFFADNQTIVDLFEQLGFPARRGEIRVEYSGTEVRVAVGAEGQGWYEGVGSRTPTDPFYLTSFFRWFYVPNGGTPIWTNENASVALQTQVDAFVLNVYDGFLRNIKPGGAGYMAAITEERMSRETISFDRL